MRVVLLYPEVYDMARFAERRKEFPPFGVLSLAAVIEEAGHKVSIQKITPTETYPDLTSFEAVGFSLASSATYGFMRQARNNAAIRDNVGAHGIGFWRRSCGHAGWRMRVRSRSRLALPNIWRLSIFTVTWNHAVG